MDRASVVKVIVMLAFVALALGCCAMLQDLRSGSGSGEGHMLQLWNNSHIVRFNVTLMKGDEARVHIVSDRLIDILVMDRANFSNYYATEQGNATAWSAFAAAVNLTDGGLNFTAPEERDYLFVLDNTPLNEGGAPGDTWANYSDSYSYHWHSYPAPIRWLLGN
jgi:hypothetical protein